jgi:hypothetical protein
LAGIKSILFMVGLFAASELMRFSLVHEVRDARACKSEAEAGAV